MRKIYTRISFLISALLVQNLLQSQCGTLTPLGTSSNLFTHIRNATNPVAADKVLNTVVFVHRNNATAFGGNSGTLRYDVSTNNGASWISNQGILNPLTTNLSRYPNITIYNPAANTNTANAYIGYLAATINPTTSAWNGVVSGVRNLTGTGNTENYNQPVVNPQLIAHSVVKGAPGVFWAIDALFNGTNITGLTIYKGVWSSLSSDIVWSNNFSVTPPFNTAYSGIPQIGDYNIAFDPTGNIGWFSFLSHVSPGPTAYAYYPVFYKTTNGGATWTGPIQVDLNQFSCITGNMASPNVPTTNFEHDLTVDVNGVPHMITTICNGTSAYSVLYTQWHHMFDITQKSGMWVANDLATVLAGRATWGTAPNAVSQDMAPQASRSADGTKLFFTWTDNSAYTLGTANTSPNLYGKAYNVTNDTWTQVKEFTSCNIGTAGKIIFPHVAPEVLEPSLNLHKLAHVYGEFSVPTDPVQIANFNFLDNITFSASEFTVASPAATINIVPGPTVLFCPNSTVNISLAGTPGQLMWNNGSTVNPLPITTGSVSTYSVIAQVGCNIGTASVTVTTVSISASASSPSICIGGSLTLNASGSASGYTWTPANLTGTSVTVFPTINSVTLSGGGSGGCMVTQTLALVIMPLPTLSLAGTNTICAGTVLSQTVSGASTYTWNTGATGSTFTDTPIVNTSYTVTGSDVNQCVNSGTLYVVVKQSPTVNIISTQTAVCAGQSLTLTATGASTYSWNNTTGPASASFTPTVNTSYTLTGVATNLCQNTKTLAVVVYSLPVISVVPTKTLFCKGEKTKLTASGAASYTWVAEGALSPSVSVSPTITSTYTILGTSSNGCGNSTVYTLQVSACTDLKETLSNKFGFKLYPNPNNGEFVIKATLELEVKIYSETGQEVQTLKLNEDNNFQVFVSGLSDGIYFVTGRQDNESIHSKVLILH